MAIDLRDVRSAWWERKRKDFSSDEEAEMAWLEHSANVTRFTDYLLTVEEVKLEDLVRRLNAN